MKKISYILFVAGIVAVSCAKESNNTYTAENNKIIAIIKDKALDDSDVVKTTYDEYGNFSWEAGNSITVQLFGKEGTVNEGKYDKFTFTADGTGAETTFSTASAYTNWVIGDYAFYPKNLASSEKPFDLVYNNDNPITVSLPAETGDYLVKSNYMSIIPLIGTRTGENTFNFSTATGVLKLNFSDVPNIGGLRLELSHPTYPLCGTFSVSEQNTILASNYISGSATRQLRPEGGFSTVYVALPIGVISAGLDIKLYKGETIYFHIATSTDIEIKRNTLTELTVPIVAVSSSVAVSGTAAEPQLTLSVTSGEEIAYAVAATKDDAINSLNGATWYSTSYSYNISLSEGVNFIAYKVKKGGHVYLKHAIEFYHIPTGNTTILGTYNISGNPAHALTFAGSDDLSKGNIMVTNNNTWSLEGKIYGKFTNTQLSIDDRQVFNQHSNTNYYGLHNGSNGAPSGNLTFDVSTDGSGKTVFSREGFGIGQATVSGGVATNYTATSLKWTAGTCEITHQ